jgi:predicted transcriptional regulator
VIYTVSIELDVAEMAESSVIVRVDEELKAAFADAAKAADRTASQLLRDFMRDFVKSQGNAAEYDAWFRRQVASGIADARAGRVRSSRATESHFAKRRAATRKKIAGRSR